MKRIKLTQGQFAIVDDKNYEWLNQWKWCAWWSKDTKSFYAVRRSKKRNGKSYIIRMAREILGLKCGDKREADHRNHNTLDNFNSNLRTITHQQNQFIGVNGKTMYLGLFPTAEEAHNAYLTAKRKYHNL